MTDSDHPQGPPRRRDASREPATIDLHATVVDEGKAPLASEPGAAAAGEAESEAAASRAADERAAEERAAEAERSETSENASRSEGPAEAPAPEPISAQVEAEGVAAPPPAAASPPPARGPGAGALLAASILGGVVGAGLLYGIETWRESQAEEDPRIAALEQRLGSVARQDAVRALEGRIGAIEGAQTALASRVAAAQARADEAFNRPAPVAPAAAAAPAQDNSAVSDLAQKLDGLSTRLDGIEKQAAAALEAANGAKEAAAGASQAAGAARDAANAAGQAASSAGQAAERRAADLASRLGEADQRATALDQRLAGLDKRVGDVAKQVAEGGSETTRAGTRVVVAQRLNDALKEGAPYAESLAALRRLGPDTPTLAALDPFAESGAPTAATLARSFKPLGERIVRETRPSGGDWTDRVARIAERIVSVKPVDNPSSGDPESLVARIDAALARGSFADAATAFDALPENARKIAAGWGETLKQRAAAEVAARAAAAEAIAALTPATR